MTGSSELRRIHTRAEDIIDALVIRENDLTLITLRNGDIPLENNFGYGLYYRDCRFLSGYVLTINGKKPMKILSNDKGCFSSVIVLTNPQLRDNNGAEVEKNTIDIRRDRFIVGMVGETLSVTNFNDFCIAIDIGLTFGSDFEDIFTVRGITKAGKGKVVRHAYENGTRTVR